MERAAFHTANVFILSAGDSHWMHFLLNFTGRIKVDPNKFKGRRLVYTQAFGRRLFKLCIAKAVCERVNFHTVFYTVKAFDSMSCLQRMHRDAPQRIGRRPKLVQRNFPLKLFLARSVYYRQIASLLNNLSPFNRIRG